MKINAEGTGINLKEKKELLFECTEIYERLLKQEDDFTGWVNLPFSIEPELVEDIKITSEEIRKKCSLFIVIGIGGSYMGARAVCDALGGSRARYPEVIFAGFNMCGSHLQRVLDRVDEEEVCICAISKSGRTVEPLLAYSIIKEKLFEKYGRENAAERIYVITDRSKGNLRVEANSEGYKSFAVPDDIGGRYSVLTAVGLLPIAVAGHDIRAMLEGAAEMAEDEAWHGDLMDYTVTRRMLQMQGRKIEVFEFFEYGLNQFGMWLQQLFGESEGKEGKGVFPTYLNFSTDLHSMGQFLQQGSQMFYETVILIKKPMNDLEIPRSAGSSYAGRTLEMINACAAEGVMRAHIKNGIPVISIEIEKINEYCLGGLLYFFEMSCAVSAYQMGVNPFDQPGVEAYKNEMRALIEEL